MRIPGYPVLGYYWRDITVGGRIGGGVSIQERADFSSARMSGKTGAPTTIQHCSVVP